MSSPIRSRVKIIKGMSPSTPGTSFSEEIAGDFSCFDSILAIGTITAVNGTLQVTLEGSWDGVEWFEAASFPLLDAIPSTGTFKVTQVLQDQYYKIGVSSLTTPTNLIMPNTNTSSPWGDLIRAKFIAGAGTTTGAQQIIRLIGVTSTR